MSKREKCSSVTNKDLAKEVEYMDNNVIELLSEINFCPYCGSNDIERDKEEDSCNCNECGRDFTIMTHE